MFVINGRIEEKKMEQQQQKKKIKSWSVKKPEGYRHHDNSKNRV